MVGRAQADALHAVSRPAQTNFGTADVTEGKATTVFERLPPPRVRNGPPGGSNRDDPEPLVVADNRREVGKLIEDEANFVGEAHGCFLGKKNNVPRKVHLPAIIKTIKTTPRCRDLHPVYYFFKLYTLRRHDDLDVFE